MDSLELFVVKSKDGKYFRSKGYGGGGNSWVDSLQKAKIYPRIGPARTQVSFWAEHYPEYGVPDIVVLTVTGTKILNEEERVKKASLKRKRDELSRELRWAEEKLRNAEAKVKALLDQKELQKAQEKVNKIKTELNSIK